MKILPFVLQFIVLVFLTAMTLFVVAWGGNPVILFALTLLSLISTIGMIIYRNNQKKFEFISVIGIGLPVIIIALSTLLANSGI